MVSLLVASAGGHLRQLRSLPIDRSQAKLITYTAEDARSLADIDAIAYAHHPTTRSLPNAVRNFRLARRVFAQFDISRVVSTGAAVAVPFMVRARQLGIPCHYIESATRVNGPSLSGRMLQRLRGVHLYRQMGDWGEPRWKPGPCVFDGYATHAGPTGEVTRVVVSLGTHRFAFEGVVTRLREVLAGSGADVLWQLGSTPDPGDLPGRVVARLPADELQDAIADADVVVGHAGVGLSLTALAAGKVPVLLPRRRRRREHTDDHQMQLARELQRRGLAVTAEVEELSDEHLTRAAALTVTHEPPPPFELVD